MYVTISSANLSSSESLKKVIYKINNYAQTNENYVEHKLADTWPIQPLKVNSGYPLPLFLPLPITQRNLSDDYNCK